MEITEKNSFQNNRRIAKNTLMLYFRMILTMLVSLYTSRVVLNTLGVEDFGIYNVVGGVISLFSFIVASMSSATSRFLTYSLGKNESKELKDVFKASFTIHLFIAFIIFILAETIGLWFLNNKLIIPKTRMLAAQFIYHTAVIGSIFSIVQVPYTASIFSHEKMDIYAFFEIFLTILRLIIVISLTYIAYDKLISYAFLLLGVNIVSFLLYTFYSSKNFTECRPGISRDKEILQPMLFFSGWDLYGNMSTVARTQGVNMLLNIFFGPLLNAAYGISTSVQNAVNALSGNVLVAVKPQVVKSYANNKTNYTIQLLNNTAKFTTILLLFVIIPISIEMPFVLKIWLKNVPEYTSVFCILTLGFILIANLSTIIMSAIHATGKIKKSSIWNGTLYLSVIPLAYFAFKEQMSPIIPFGLNILFVAIGWNLNMWYLKTYLPQFSIKSFYRESIFPPFIIGTIAFIASIILYSFFEQGWIRLILVFLVSSTTILSCTYLFLLTSEQRILIKSIVKRKFNRHEYPQS